MSDADIFENDNDDAGGGADDWGAALAEQKSAEGGEDGGDDDVSSISFDNLASDSVAASTGGSDTPNLEAIMNIPVTVSMEIGRTKISIRNLLQLNQGSVVELDRLAGEPLDVLANGTLIAHGEVVVINEKFGIRLTDVVSAQERVKNLQ
jgi:flagellar motor switch protein FliN/FliY